MESQGKTRRRRAFAHKVRTGCSTCKRRRKKCDEERPTCRRCRDGDFVCDGYPDPSSNVEHSRGEVKTVDDVAMHQHNQLVLQQRRLPGNPSVLYFHHHFFNYTLPDLMDIPHSASFWNETVVALLQQSPFIQPGLAALGAAHWLFLLPVDHHQVQSFISSQYNQAISDLIPVLEAGQRPDLAPIMTCCLLFVCLESIRGKQANALQHLESGSRLFLDRSPASAEGETPLQRLAVIFHTLGNQVAFLSGSRLVPDPAPHLSSFRETETADAPSLSSIAEADDLVNRLDGYYNRIVWTESSTCLYYVDGECACPGGCGCLGCVEWIFFERQVNRFSLGLQRLVAALEDAPVERQCLLCLQLLDKIWQWTVKDEGGELDQEGREGMAIDAANEMLDLAQRLLILSAERPTYSLSTDIIPTLVTVFDICRSPISRQRVIDLLRAYRRTEVIFDSHQVAAYLEHHMSSEQLDDWVPDERAEVFSGWPRAFLCQQTPSS